MIGFEIKFRGETIRTAIAEGSNGVIVGKRENEFYLDVSGMEKETQTFHRWFYKENLKLGEEIEIEVKDIEQTSEPMNPEQYMPYFSGTFEQRTEEERNVINQKRLESFYALENKLLEEGLL